MNKKIMGLDLVSDKPDYSKTWEENHKDYRERYKKVYGEYPPEITEEEIKKQSKSSKNLSKIPEF